MPSIGVALHVALNDERGRQFEKFFVTEKERNDAVTMHHLLTKTHTKKGSAFWKEFLNNVFLAIIAGFFAFFLHTVIGLVYLTFLVLFIVMMWRQKMEAQAELKILEEKDPKYWNSIRKRLAKIESEAQRKVRERWRHLW
jgi:uncharacterized membrane protein